MSINSVVTCVVIATILAVPRAWADTRTSATVAQHANDCSAYVSSGADADEIRRLEEVGARSNVEGWSLEAAKAFFAPEWQSVGPDGSVAGVDTVYAAFENGVSKPCAGRFELKELDIRVYCDMALVVGLGEAVAIGAADTAKPTRFRYLNVWRKEGDRWLYATQQFTRY